MTCKGCKYASCVSILESQYKCSNGHEGIQEGQQECPDSEPKTKETLPKEDWWE